VVVGWVAAITATATATGGRLRRHRGDRTQLLAVGARPRQGVRLLLNRHPLFQVYAEALVLRRETGAYRYRGLSILRNARTARRSELF